MYTPHCLTCNNKFTTDYSIKTQAWINGKLEYFSLICNDCKLNYAICEYCGDLHYISEDPICEPLDPGLKEMPSYPGDDTTH